MKRESHSLTDQPWRFCPDPSGNGEDLGFPRSDCDTRMWPEVEVPSCFEAGGANLEGYEGICWYRRSFTVPEHWHGRRVALRFGAVNYRARVWLNGSLLGESRDGFLPFEFELQDGLSRDGSNTVAVAVDNRHHEGDVPGMHTGWRGFGGILREVVLVATGRIHIEDVCVIAAPGPTGGDMTFRLRARNGLSEARAISAEIEVRDREGQTCQRLVSETVAVDGDGTAEVVLRGALERVEAWSPSSPVLYSARARLQHDGETIDEVEEVPFGFRTIEATPDGLLLNGQRIFLTGFNRHDDSPRTGMAFDSEVTRADLEAMKEAGANFVRLCHYPHASAELDMCDELGLLVLAEIPLYFWNDEEEGQRTQAARARSAARQLARMITCDANHPSIIFWSVSNETRETEAEVVADNAELIRLARRLDSTRLCVHVSNHWVRTPHFEEDDVICVNYYPSLTRQQQGHHPVAADLAESADSWRANLEALHEAFPGKPVLITEFGYCSLAGTRGHSLGEDAHARALDAEFAAFDAPFVCGAAIWCWADHPWPRVRFLGGLSFSPFGVLSRDREKLEPFWTARALFQSRQAAPGAAEEITA